MPTRLFYYVCVKCNKLVDEDHFTQVNYTRDKDGYVDYVHYYLCPKCLKNRLEKEKKDD